MTTLLHILQHSLGRDQYGKAGPSGDYRNHFCTGPSCDNFALCREAVAQGLMTEHAPREISGGDHIFKVTDAGREYIAANSPAPPKVSRGKARYLKWLEVSDCAPDLSFGEWLKARGAK